MIITMYHEEIYYDIIRINIFCIKKKIFSFLWKVEQWSYKNYQKDESLGSFHWCLIRTPHSYPLKHTPTESLGKPNLLYEDNVYTRPA